MKMGSLIAYPEGSCCFVCCDIASLSSIVIIKTITFFTWIRYYCDQRFTTPSRDHIRIQHVFTRVWYAQTICVQQAWDQNLAKKVRFLDSILLQHAPPQCEFKKWEHCDNKYNVESLYYDYTLNRISRLLTWICYIFRPTM